MIIGAAIHKDLFRGLSDTDVFIIMNDSRIKYAITVGQPELHKLSTTKRYCQNRPFSRFRILYAIQKKIRHPIGNKKTGFSPGKLGHS